MPKGIYDRSGMKASGGQRTWFDEHDAKLRELIEEGGLSFGQVLTPMREAFPRKEFTRSGCIGRAHRLGLKCKNGKGGRVGYGRVAKPKKVKEIEMLRRVGKRVLKKDLAPVVLRDEGDRGAANSPAGSRKLGLNDPVVIERKKGNLPAIIEEAPLTSVPVSCCESQACMWPTSTDVRCMEVCGEPVEVGAYCARHALVAYRVLPTARRNGVRHKEDREYERRIDGSQHRDHLDPDGEWLGRMILEEVVTAPADEPLLEIPHFIGVK